MTKPRKGATGKPQLSGNGQVGTCACNCYGEDPPSYSLTCCGDCNAGLDNRPDSLDVTFSGITNCGTDTVFTPQDPNGATICDSGETPDDTETPCSVLNGTTFNCVRLYGYSGPPAYLGSNLCWYEFIGTDEPFCTSSIQGEISLGKTRVKATLQGGSVNGKVSVYAFTGYQQDTSLTQVMSGVCFYSLETIANVWEECTNCETMPITLNETYSEDADDCWTIFTNEGYGGTATVDRG